MTCFILCVSSPITLGSCGSLGLIGHVALLAGVLLNPLYWSSGCITCKLRMGF